MKAKFKGMVCLGVRTKKFDELLNFYQNTIGLPFIYEEPGFRAIDLLNGDRIEIFSEEYKNEEYDYKDFATGPVVGFLVDDIETTKKEMEAEGIEFLDQIREGGNSKWVPFRGVDGNTYEIKEIKS